MQCPNCRLEQPDNAEACSGCGLIFAKWRERHPEAAAPPKAAPPPQPASFRDDPLSENLSLESAGPGPSKDAPGPPPAEEPYIPPANRWSKPLPEPEYQEFPVKKFAIIAIGLLSLGLGGYFFLPSLKGGYATPKVIERPTSIAGSAIQTTQEPTWTPVPCGYPFDTCTPTPIATPMTISGPAWQYHGRVLDELHLSPINGANIIFYNNGVAVTATTNADGMFQISVPPLSGKEIYEVELHHPNFRDGYWMEDPEGFSEQDRIARAYDYPENEHLRGKDGGGGEDQNLVFSMFPGQLTEQEQMWIQNARPSQPSQ